MVEIQGLCVRDSAGSHQDPYQSIDPSFWEYRAADVPAVAVIDGSYGPTSFLYLWRYPFYIPKTNKNTEGDCQRFYKYWYRWSARIWVRWPWNVR
jgi:hypothetical protein